MSVKDGVVSADVGGKHTVLVDFDDAEALDFDPVP